MNGINYSDACLIDFLDIENKKIFERAEIFSGFLNYLENNKHLNYRRVLTTGCSSHG